MKFSIEPIGVIRTPFKEQKGTPIQSRFAKEAKGEIVVYEPFGQALKDLEGFERIWLVFYLDRAKRWQPLVVPYRDTVKRGLFATRAPSRPCPIGLSVVSLERVEQNTLTVKGVDILDETPLLDIKPYVPDFDAFPESRAGWFDTAGTRNEQADGRFDKE